MSDLTVRASVESRLSWKYDFSLHRTVALYERAKQGQWNATTDVDWTLEVPFGAPLEPDSGFALEAFSGSSLARYGFELWDTFRWERQAWMVSQFLHGEQGALVATARLAEVLVEVENKAYAASQVNDEARHLEVFARYLHEKIPSSYPVSAPLAALIEDILTDTRWDVTALGMQMIVEPLAMASFRLANSTFHDPLIKQITRLVALDEARHMSFGLLLLQPLYRELTAAELREREECVLQAAALMSRRFLLEDVWDRLGIDREEGTEFAARNPLMVAYRRTTFSKVVSGLSQIGLMTDRVVRGLDALGLLGRWGARAACLVRS